MVQSLSSCSSWTALSNLEVYCWSRLQWTSENKPKQISSPWQQFQYVPICYPDWIGSLCSFFIFEPTALWFLEEWTCLLLLLLLHLAVLTVMDLQASSQTLFCHSYNLGLLSICSEFWSHCLLFHLNTYPVCGLYRCPILNKAILFIVPQALRVLKPAHFCCRVCRWSSSVKLSVFLHSFWWAAGFAMAWLQISKWHRPRASLSAGY